MGVKKHSTLPFARLLKKHTTRRKMGVNALAKALQCSKQTAYNKLWGHGIPERKAWLACGVIFGWIKKVDGSIMNDHKGIKKTIDYFESDEPYSTAEEIAEVMLSKEVMRKMRTRKTKRRKERKRKEAVKRNREERENQTD